MLYITMIRIFSFITKHSIRKVFMAIKRNFKFDRNKTTHVIHKSICSKFPVSNR